MIGLCTVTHMRRVTVAGVHVEQGSDNPFVLLREFDAPHRVLPIHIGGPEAASIAMALTGHVPPRPLAHDVMAELLGRFGARVVAAEVVELRNGTFIACLSLTGPHGPEQVDSRASDAIALAMRVGAPVYVAEHVLVEAGASPELLEDDWFDECLGGPELELELEDFCAFLEGVEADDFADECDR